MNYPTEAGDWTPEQAAEAMLAIALDQAPGWADKAWLLGAIAREAAPEAERVAWVEVVQQAFADDLATTCSRIVDTAGATPDQMHRFGQEVASLMAARFAELQLSGIVDGGKA